MQEGNFIDVFLVLYVSGAYAHHQEQPTQRLSRPPPIQKLGAENRMLQLNI